MDGIIVFIIVTLAAAYIGNLFYKKVKAAGTEENSCCCSTCCDECLGCQIFNEEAKQRTNLKIDSVHPADVPRCMQRGFQ
ncbi:MAG: hypothetical protein JRF40_11280 [Deltaproteobacteria bacterium]|nr:hypothetical protein [Deltaproteobacteria bacterium]